MNLSAIVVTTHEKVKKYKFRITNGFRGPSIYRCGTPNAQWPPTDSSRIQRCPGILSTAVCRLLRNTRSVYNSVVIALLIFHLNEVAIVSVVVSVVVVYVVTITSIVVVSFISWFLWCESIPKLLYFKTQISNVFPLKHIAIIDIILKTIYINQWIVKRSGFNDFTRRL